METGAVSVRLHHGGPQGAKPKGESRGGYFGGHQRAAGVAAFADRLSATQQITNLRYSLGVQNRSVDW